MNENLNFDRVHCISDLFDVGPFKPLASANLNALTYIFRKDPVELQHCLEEKGLKVLTFDDRNCREWGGTLYAYHESALNQVLESNKAILEDNKWPTHAEGFIGMLALYQVPAKTPLFDVISEAYGDKADPGRTDRAVPDYSEDYDPRYLAELRRLEQENATSFVTRSGYKPR